MSAKAKKSLVAAIDFGTTYSGCAYSFRDDFEKDPLKVFNNDKWSGGFEATSVPTSVLLNEKKEFDSFGSKAEEKYSQLALRKEHEKWYLFRRFKMTLHNNENLARNTEIEDVKGEKMRAVIIFSLAIKDIKERLLENLKIQGHNIKEEDIHWVLTVPAIWTEAAKQFMQEASVEAGIPLSRLTLALEPEAAAVFCKELTTHKQQGKDKALLKAFDPGSKYLVLDLGGGTVDLTIQEVLKPDAKLKILDKASGGAWGGVTVDNYFLQFIKKLVGIELYLEFAEKYSYQKMEFEKELESCKRKANPGSQDALFIKIPNELKEMYEKQNKRQFDDSITKQTHFSGGISMIDNTMEIKPKLIQEFYDKTINSIIQHVKSILDNETAKGVTSMLLVGGFAESSIVQNRIKKEFEGERIERVIVPREAGLAIVKGAVIYGHNPHAIAQRVSPYTYGVQTRRPFDPKKDQPKRMKKTPGGKEVVENVFNIHIKAGEIMYIGKPNFEHLFYQIDPKLESVFWKVFRTEAKNPSFCDEQGCVKIGKLEIKLEGLSLEKKRELSVRMICKGTVLEAEATDKETKKHLSAEFDFLSE